MQPAVAGERAAGQVGLLGCSACVCAMKGACSGGSSRASWAYMLVCVLWCPTAHHVTCRSPELRKCIDWGGGWLPTGTENVLGAVERSSSMRTVILTASTVCVFTGELHLYMLGAHERAARPLACQARPACPCPAISNQLALHLWRVAHTFSIRPPMAADPTERGQGHVFTEGDWNETAILRDYPYYLAKTRVSTMTVGVVITHCTALPPSTNHSNFECLLSILPPVIPTASALTPPPPTGGAACLRACIPAAALAAVQHPPALRAGAAAL